MKYIRYFLYLALIVVFMILWNDWQIDYQSKAKQASVNTTSQVAQNINEDKNSGIIQEQESASQQIQKEDIQKQEVKAIPQTPNNRIIHINTDVLNIDIDTLGGKIIKATLPKYYTSLQDKTPLLLLNENPDTLYIAQDGLYQSNGLSNQLQYSASQKQFTLDKNQNQIQIILNAKDKQGLEITKIFTFKRNNYEINVEYKIKNQSGKTWIGNYYMQLNRSIGEKKKKTLFSLPSFFGVAISTPDKPYKKLSFKKISEQPIDQSDKGGWLAMVQNYFLSVWVPNKDINYHYYSVTNNGLYSVGIKSPILSIKPGQSLTLQSNFYTGPKVAANLDAVAPHLSLTIDFGWLWIISVAIFWLMKFIYGFIGNWGWSIVMVTILIKLAFYKLSETSYKSMAGMRKLQPKIQQLKERYGDDKQGMQKAMMGMYKKEKINPLGGCLPMVIQIPFFLALYWVLLYSVELRQAPFIFWIKDLSVKDPYYVLPILMGVSMFLQQKLNPTPPDPTQAKMMMFLPIVFTLFFLNFPAGLVLYWLTNNVISFAQQWHITRKFEHGGYKHHDKDKRKKKPWWKFFNEKGFTDFKKRR
jgi:YidC/Oxa1 family membrane protein insertase